MIITLTNHPPMRYETVHIREAKEREEITDELLQQGIKQPSQFLTVLEGYVHLADDDGHEFIYRLGAKRHPQSTVWPMTYRSGKRCDCCPPSAIQNRGPR